MNRWLLALLLAVTLATSNFLYQAATRQDWNAALERSWFQAIALFIFAWWVGAFGGAA